MAGARSLTWGDRGTLFVGTRESKVYAVDKSGKVYTIATGLNMPNGVAFRNGSLYVAEISRIQRFDKIEDHLSKPRAPIVITNDYPTETHHGWKFIAFGPDGKLYVPVGAPCNICESKDLYAALTVIDADGRNRRVVARGIRNTVGFDWHPITKELWFTDNGRDLLGNDQPADELNRMTKEGQHFGYPYCHQGDILDPQYGRGKNCSDYIPPEQKLGPHVAGLGMRFYTGSQFPSEFKQQIFIAEHGSWNRDEPIGYRVTLVKLGADGHAANYQPFAEGWLQRSGAWGRPVDVVVSPDGSLLVSDDMNGVIYKIQYH